MATQAVPQEVFAEFLDARLRSNQPSMSADEFFTTLHLWYNAFQASECTLGYVAEQLGVTKIDLIALLDMLEWKTTNL